MKKQRKSTVTHVWCNDYEALYVDGKLVFTNNVIGMRDFVEAVKDVLGVVVEYKTAESLDETDEEFPDNIKDLGQLESENSKLKANPKRRYCNDSACGGCDRLGH